MRISIKKPRLIHFVAGACAWFVLMFVGMIFVTTARAAESWNADVGFWVWTLSWLVLCILVVWLSDND